MNVMIIITIIIAVIIIASTSLLLFFFSSSGPKQKTTKTTKERWTEGNKVENNTINKPDVLCCFYSTRDVSTVPFLSFSFLLIFEMFDTHFNFNLDFDVFFF